MSKDGTDGAKAPTAGAPDLRSLIEMLENATEGSWELDSAIAVTVFDGEWRPYSPRARSRWLYVRGTNKCLVHGQQFLARYTTSIDAALTLVPGECDWMLNGRYNHAEVWQAKETGRDGVWRSGDCAPPTPAVALCIAALKARQAANQGGPTGSPDRGVAPGISEGGEK